MCPVRVSNDSAQLYATGDNDDILSSSLPLFYIDVYTYSTEPHFYSMFVAPVSNFVLK